MGLGGQGSRAAWAISDRSRPGQVESRLADEVHRHGYSACVAYTSSARRTLARVHRIVQDSAPVWVDFGYVQPGGHSPARLDVWAVDGRVALETAAVTDGTVRIEWDRPADPLPWP